MYTGSAASSPPIGGDTTADNTAAVADAMQAYQNMAGMQNAGFYAAQTQSAYGVLPQSYTGMSDGKLH